jgi:hypothetical protein
MIDDPLSLLSLGIWLMAAGMWPVGFLFGACSACCGECPEECNKCTHFYNNNPQFPVNPDCGVINDLGTINWSIAGFGATFGFESEIIIDNPDLPEDLIPDEWGSLTINVSDSIGGFLELDECGCPTCNYESPFTATFQILSGGFFKFGASAPGTLSGCDETQIEFDCSDLSWQVVEVNASYDEELKNLVIAALIEYLDALQFSSSFDDIPPCDCGACCDTPTNQSTTCEENVAEGYCQNVFNVADRQWQGVGTSCDPNPCEEE